MSNIWIQQHNEVYWSPIQLIDLKGKRLTRLGLQCQTPALSKV